MARKSNRQKEADAPAHSDASPSLRLVEEAVVHYKCASDVQIQQQLAKLCAENRTIAQAIAMLQVAFPNLSSTWYITRLGAMFSDSKTPITARRAIVLAFRQLTNPFLTLDSSLLLQLLSDPNAKVRAAATWVLSHYVALDNGLVVERLLSAICDSDPEVSVEAMRALRQQGRDAVRKALPELKAVLSKGTREQQLEVIQTFVLLKLTDGLTHAVGLHDSFVSMQALQILQSFVPPESSDRLCVARALGGAIRDGDQQMSLAAMGALRNVGRNAASAVACDVVCAFEKGDEERVHQALATLAWLEADARAAIPSLVQAMVDKRVDGGKVASTLIQIDRSTDQVLAHLKNIAGREQRDTVLDALRQVDLPAALGLRRRLEESWGGTTPAGTNPTAAGGLVPMAPDDEFTFDPEPRLLSQLFKKRGVGRKYPSLIFNRKLRSIRRVGSEEFFTFAGRINNWKVICRVAEGNGYPVGSEEIAKTVWPNDKIDKFHHADINDAKDAIESFGITLLNLPKVGYTIVEK